MNTASRARSVLLAEDNEDDILLVLDALDSEELLRVTGVVRDGEEVMAFLRSGVAANESWPDLLLLDINMPKKDGFQVLDEIKADPQLRALPVIMLTTSRRQEDVARCYASGACSYLHKPSTPEDLRRMTRSFAVYWTEIASLPSRT